MRFGSTAFAVAAFAAAALVSTPGLAADAKAGMAGQGATTYDSGFVPTQGRGARRGRGGSVVVVQPRRRNNVGRNVAIGVGAAVLGAAVVSQGARAQGGSSCRRWAFMCDDGARWACRNYFRYC